MNEWINVKNGFPSERNGWYICLLNNFNDGFFTLASFDNFHKPTFYAKCEDITDNVLYYFKIPKIPKENKPIITGLK